MFVSESIYTASNIFFTQGGTLSTVVALSHTGPNAGVHQLMRLVEEKIRGRCLEAFDKAGCRSLRIWIPTVGKYCGSCAFLEIDLFSSDMDRAVLRHGRKEIERIGS